MALEDIHPRDGEDFLEVWPISTRHMVPGLAYLMSVKSGIGETGWPAWPTENEPGWSVSGGAGKEYYCFYNDDIPGFSPVNFLDQGLAIYYDDNFSGNQIYADRRSQINPSTGFQSNLYIPANGYWIYDLTGLDASQIERAEWVAGIYANTQIVGGSAVSNPNIDTLPMKAFLNRPTSFQGYTPSWMDHRTMGVQTQSIFPAFTNQQLAGWSSPGGGNPYQDEYADPEYHGSNPYWQFAIPISDTGRAQLRSGGTWGLQFGFAGQPQYIGGSPSQADNPPFGYFNTNNVFVSTQYWTWDEGMDEAQPAHIAGAELPCLRLWMGGKTEVAADVTIDVEVSAGALLLRDEQVQDAKVKQTLAQQRWEQSEIQRRG
jgi:hypothetical protein